MRAVRARPASVLLALCAALALGLGSACVAGGIVTLTIADDAGTSNDGAPGGDDEDADDAAEELTPTTVCGAAPWVDIGLTVFGASISNPDGTPLPGARFTSPLCPGMVQYSDDAGLIQGQVSQGVAFYARLEAKYFIPMLAPELLFAKDTKNVKVIMPPAAVQIILPDAGQPDTWILVGVQKNGGHAACNLLDGVSLAVPGHPEAVVTYYTADKVPQPMPGAAATSTGGTAAITGLAPNQTVDVVATKPGCTVTAKKEPFTGRIPLEAKFISLMPAYVSD